ncbi:serine hydrolase domain-containing protein [Puniceicoccus vermicola]|uniref:Beta-lactamase family protein n=1 Tax=Puniceicoccus vermicola TaxID=388746 RepID=A0A7X1B1U5_9BACT|nr:serine hydrolase domain-containing protein [Puniceicoccus vermicola]MBC2604064.1 beta-lactamase family protein [Puniceicoccus vermicola]
MRFSLFLISILAPFTHPTKASERDFSHFQEDLESFREENGLTSMVVGVWRQGEPAFREAFGTSMPGTPADLSMKFRAGGTCLTSVTAVLLKTVESGKVSLDDTIEKWMPDLPKSDEVTLRMLANCTAGYGDYVPNEEFISVFEENPFRFFTPEELIDYGLDGGMSYEPGTDWAYSHTTFVILGMILEKIHGKPVPQLLEEMVFTPLELSDTVYTPGPALEAPILHAYTTERGPFEDSTFWNPSWTSYSGSIASTVDDVAGIFRSIGAAELISPESLAEMIAPTTVGLGRNTKERYYGMGLGVMGDWIMQNPNFGGYRGIILYNMKTDVTVVAFVTLGSQTDPNTHYGMKLMPLLMQQ